MDMPQDDVFDIIEVRFKNGRKEFYQNPLQGLVTGDAIVVDVPNGHHIGYVSLQGELVRLQMRKKGVKEDEEIRKVYRLASAKDLEKWDEVQNRELPTLYRTREIIQDLNLQMKLTDVEYQADNTKATFYYSADERVDFRELIKILAGEFKIRVEMRQISLRQEAGRLGGIGSCGRELCCSTWLTDFKSVSTGAARYQNLSLNPSKLSGQCGRLKCCLNYELDTYMEALRDIPEVKVLKTEKGDAKLQKTDIFRKIMWFGFAEDTNWYALDVERVNEILAMNKRGEIPASLGEEEEEVKLNEGTLFLNSDLEQLDSKYRSKKKKKKKKRGGSGNGGDTQQAQAEQPSQNQSAEGRSSRNKSRRKPKGRKPEQEGAPQANDQVAKAQKTPKAQGQGRGGNNRQQQQQNEATGPDDNKSRQGAQKSRSRRKPKGQQSAQSEQGKGNKPQQAKQGGNQPQQEGSNNKRRSKSRRKPGGNKPRNNNNEGKASE